MSRIAPLVFILLLLPGAVPAVEKPAQPNGVTFRFVQKMESTTPRGPTARELRGKTALRPGSFRIDFEKGLGLLQDGCWLVSTDGGKSLSLVLPPDPSKKRLRGSVARVDLEATVEAAGEAMKDMKGFMSFRATTPRIQVKVDPQPVFLLGLETRRTTIEVAYQLETSIQGVTRSMKISSTSDYWMTGAFGDAPLPLLDGRSALRTGYPDVDRILKAEAGSLKGLPLKMKSHSETTDPDGKTTSTESSLMVVDLKRVDIPNDLFAVPESYRLIEPLSLLGLAR